MRAPSFQTRSVMARCTSEILSAMATNVMVGGSAPSLWWINACMRVPLAISALASVLAGAQPAAAGGFGIPEIGVRRTAMASVIGRPDDASSIFHNPAGLVLGHGWQLY